jgi:sulfate transport system permease protein
MTLAALVGDGGRAGAARPPSGVIPGFGLTLGLTLAYLGLIVLIPLAGVFLKTAELSWTELWQIAVDSRTLAALRLSFGAALGAALLNALIGPLVAWVLARYDFPLKRLVDGMIDLPFALPTAVAGISLTAVYSPSGWLGAPLSALGLQIAFTPLGVVLAMAFVGLPFVVRTVQPVLADLTAEAEEAAATLGATRPQTVRRIIAPILFPPLLTGFALAFARGVGEYGSVIFIAGNMPYVTEIAPLLIVIQLEEYDYAGATAIAAIMLVISFVLLLAINLLHAWTRRATGHV